MSPGHVREFLHAALLDGVRGVRLGLVAAKPSSLLGGQQGVLEDGQAHEGTRDLIGPSETQSGSLRRGQVGDLAPVKGDGPRVAPDVAAHHGEHGGLSGAVRPDHSNDGALLNMEVDVFGDDHGAQALVKALDIEEVLAAQTVAPAMG